MDETTDSRAAEAAREAGLDRAHEALRAQARAEAQVLASILQVVENALAHPEIEVPLGITGEKALNHAERSAILGLSLELALSQDQIRSRLTEARILSRLLPQTWCRVRGFVSFSGGNVDPVSNPTTRADLWAPRHP
ncbi:hypothetical protein GCM10022288_25820 [Gryllotalpicola kribbensis]|uniref:DUF222 domain-containing protein n=1 Tax=Gryllotalpicola kribbensis TaxID=993084 RepID=A0ABP8AXG1_9MICO